MNAYNVRYYLSAQGAVLLRSDRRLSSAQARALLSNCGFTDMAVCKMVDHMGWAHRYAVTVTGDLITVTAA